MEIDIGDLATWAATSVAVIAMIVTIFATKKSYEIQRNQHSWERRVWTDQYFSSVRAWADQVCCAISEAIHIVESSDLNQEGKFDVLVRLSAFIDTGRWYFPNVMSDRYGTKKDPAYRGIRQDILDSIIEAYDCLKSDTARAEELVRAQRKFVSCVQERLDPAKRNVEIEKILKDFEKSYDLRHPNSQR